MYWQLIGYRFAVHTRITLFTKQSMYQYRLVEIEKMIYFLYCFNGKPSRLAQGFSLTPVTQLDRMQLGSVVWRTDSNNFSMIRYIYVSPLHACSWKPCVPGQSLSRQSKIWPWNLLQTKDLWCVQQTGRVVAFFRNLEGKKRWVISRKLNCDVILNILDQQKKKEIKEFGICPPYKKHEPSKPLIRLFDWRGGL